MFNKFFSLKGLEEPYDFSVVIYQEDVLSNWYRQILDIHYTATNISKDEYVGIVRYKANKEEKKKKKNRNRK